MQIRRLNRGRLTGVKATLKASPERVSYKDDQGIRHTRVAYILSLEIGARDLRTLVANMTEPIRLLGAGNSGFDLSGGSQFVAREEDAERAAEITGEFYPEAHSHREIASVDSSSTGEESEQLARICELARRLAYNDGKAKMLIGQWRQDLAGLERKLRNQLEDIPQDIGRRNGKHQPNGRSNGRNGSANDPAAATAANEAPATKSEPGINGFLY